MQKELYTMIYEFLMGHIGEEVTFTVWRYGKLFQESGILEEVEPFNYVTISKNIVPFVGTGIAIEEIRTTKKEKLIYTNPNVKNYNIKDLMAVILAQQNMLGYSISLDMLENNQNRRR